MNDRLKEINAELLELSKMKSDVEHDTNKLLSEYVGLVQDELRPLVGRYFKAKKNRHPQMYRIIGVPKATYMMIGTIDFDPERIPAIAFSPEPKGKYELPKLTYITSACFKKGCDFITEEYDEITKEEFEGALVSAIDYITPENFERWA